MSVYSGVIEDARGDPFTNTMATLGVFTDDVYGAPKMPQSRFSAYESHATIDAGMTSPGYTTYGGPTTINRSHRAHPNQPVFTGTAANQRGSAPAVGFRRRGRDDRSRQEDVLIESDRDSFGGRISDVFTQKSAKPSSEKSTKPSSSIIEGFCGMDPVIYDMILFLLFVCIVLACMVCRNAMALSNTQRLLVLVSGKRLEDLGL